MTLAEERAQLEVREKEMRDLISKAEEKRSWFASFRDWIESVATFLDEKVRAVYAVVTMTLIRLQYPQLEKLEDEHVSLLQERYEMVNKRRKADDEDDLCLFLGMLPTPPQQATEETDEFGRASSQANPTIARRERMSARASRRSRRRAKTRASTGVEDGFSTDSSLAPADADDFAVAIEKLVEKGRDILSDVRAREFRDPKLGLGKWFSEWREKFGDSYQGAWGGLGMIGAWEFWTRLEMLGWNPLEVSAHEFTFPW